MAERLPRQPNTCFDLVSGIADVSVPISKITAIPCEEKTVDLAKSAIKFFSLCEVLDKSFGEVVLRISEREYKALPRAINENEGVFRNLLFYFTHRHVRECVEDMSLGARILFSLLAAIAVILCAEKIDGDDRYLRSAVAFSKNIEYSTENVDMVLEKISDIL